MPSKIFHIKLYLNTTGSSSKDIKRYLSKTFTYDNFQKHVVINFHYKYAYIDIDQKWIHGFFTLIIM